jgi:spermidine synthase
VLILGLGGATVAHLLLRQCANAAITGVDDDSEVLTLARQHLGLERLGVTSVHADAGQYVSLCRERYDLVIVDLFRGEELAPVATQRRFIRRVRSLLLPGGTLVWNLHRDRRSSAMRRRAGSGLVPDRRVLAGLNLVLHFRRRAYRPAVRHS